jgi:HAD superfamily hydrolase (TIGR01509 family)
VKLLPGVRALLDGLAAAGFQQAVGSSAPRANLELVLGATGVLPRLGAVVSGEDTSRGKPDPEVFRTAARRVNARAEECVVLEDAVVGIRAARAAGMRVIGVAAEASADALRQAGADLVVSSLEFVDAARLVRLLGGT